ncbi:hypothetical protein IFM12275_57070 [Nocardia sputorum]|uniref:Transcription factor WhiB n=1 Tax=Nocardia sputorum TaxID=2984338 RepID=A0ABM8CRP0_9NOCA|nr:hypothetical protein IFM12275_57070 [Nocardia sputorum]BDT97511.1 hypothetical protein IFM12276_05400 [Nocardia sputorum]
MGFDWWRDGEQDDMSAQAIIDRVAAEWRAARERQRLRAEQPDAGMWPTGWPHEAPDTPLSVTEAHLAMQRHRACRTDQCPRKAAARQTLIEAGRMRPDTSREPR